MCAFVVPGSILLDIVQSNNRISAQTRTIKPQNKESKMEKLLIKHKISLCVMGAIGEDPQLEPFRKDAEKLIDRYLLFATPSELNDVVSFIEWCKAQKKSITFASANVCHDMNGVVNMDKCFSPRTKGYSTLNRKDHIILKPSWCNCGKDEFLSYPKDGECSCGVYKHHVHCTCGAISQVG
jgi:hypothetical protein